MQTVSKSLKNRTEVKEAKVVGCYNCCKVYEPSRVETWTYDDTAVCPLCGVDAVIPEASESELAEIKKFLFA